jgi:hypothetical protein
MHLSINQSTMLRPWFVGGEVIMSTLSLFDYFLSFDPAQATAGQPDYRRAADFAARLTQELLAEHADLKEVDRELRDQFSTTGFNKQAAVALRGAYDDWARRADAVVRRIGSLRRHGQSVSHFDELRDAYGFTMAMLNTTLEDLELADEQFRRGEVVNGQEVRRELRNQLRSGGSQPVQGAGAVATGAGA